MNDYRAVRETFAVWAARVGDHIAGNLVDPFEVEEALGRVKRDARQSTAPRRAPAPVTAPARSLSAQDDVALTEIEMCGELIVAASSSENRLNWDQIDEVLRVGDERSGRSDESGGDLPHH
jgi:hypothetical protein